MPTPSAPPSSARALPTAVDAHVHLYPHVKPQELLDAAARNRPSNTGVLVLCLVDSTGSGGMDRMRHELSGDWHEHDTQDPTARRYRRASDDTDVFVIHGYQVRTAERLEVLALGTHAQGQDGLSLNAALEAAQHSGGLTVLPYGVGKWSGTRGTLVRKTIEQHRAWLCLGDNANRRRGRRPVLFQEGQQQGLPILPGTDPLPLRGDVNRAGSFGALVHTPFDPQHPTAWLQRAARDPAAGWEPFGHASRTTAFFSRQLALRTGRGRLPLKQETP
ncbi:MAG: hypothetical protein V3V20_01260 [Algisphaera sp.]